MVMIAQLFEGVKKPLNCILYKGKCYGMRIYFNKAVVKLKPPKKKKIQKKKEMIKEICNRK